MRGHRRGPRRASTSIAHSVDRHDALPPRNARDGPLLSPCPIVSFLSALELLRPSHSFRPHHNCPAHMGLQPIRRSFIQGCFSGEYYGECVRSTQVKSDKGQGKSQLPVVSSRLLVCPPPSVLRCSPLCPSVPSVVSVFFCDGPLAFLGQGFSRRPQSLRAARPPRIPQLPGRFPALTPRIPLQLHATI
jgi:hypothetical protein